MAKKKRTNPRKFSGGLASAALVRGFVEGNTKRCPLLWRLA